jgi:hypothetical protein
MSDCRILTGLIGLMLATLLPFGGCGAALASQGQLVVVEARGVALKPGQRLDAQTRFDLKEGERLRLLALDGRSIELRGPRTGPIPAAQQGASLDRSQALSTLITNRNARTGSAGVVRSGGTTASVPDPWSVDISRPGPRCVREGMHPVLWRPEPLDARTSTIHPADRSWRADIGWSDGQSQVQMPDLGPLDRATTLIVSIDQQEHGLTLLIVPASIDDEMVLAAWMLDRGCVQQADALLRGLLKTHPSAGNLIE